MPDSAPRPEPSLGAIASRAEQDKHRNDVSLITLANGHRFRMVHHTPADAPRGRSTIYRGRGVFVRVSWFTPERATMATTLEVAGYRFEWGDGDLLTVGCPGNLPAVTTTDPWLRVEDLDVAILLVLTMIDPLDHAWQRRPVRQGGSA